MWPFAIGQLSVILNWDHGADTTFTMPMRRKVSSPCHNGAPVSNFPLWFILEIALTLQFQCSCQKFTWISFLSFYLSLSQSSRTSISLKNRKWIPISTIAFLLQEKKQSPLTMLTQFQTMIQLCLILWYWIRALISATHTARVILLLHHCLWKAIFARLLWAQNPLQTAALWCTFRILPG